MAAPSRRRFLGASVSVAAAAGVIALGGGVGALLGGHRDVETDPMAPPAVPQALRAAIAREQALLQGYLAAGAASGPPGLTERTAAIVGDHTEHLRVLAVEQARITGATSIDSTVPSPAASAPAPAPATLDDALAALAALESAAAADGAAACLAGLGGAAALVDLHVLLGCIASSEAVHAAMLQ